MGLWALSLVVDTQDEAHRADEVSNLRGDQGEWQGVEHYATLRLFMRRWILLNQAGYSRMLGCWEEPTYSRGFMVWAPIVKAFSDVLSPQ